MDHRTALPVVGMVGAGPLARMTHQAAIGLGQSLRVLASAPDDEAALVTPGVALGDRTSLEELRHFAQGCDVVTFGGTPVSPELAEALVAEGVTVRPGPNALRAVTGQPLGAEPPHGLLVVVARSPWGQVATYPVVRADQDSALTLAPAPDLDEDAALLAQRLAIGVAGDIDLAGTLAVSLVETPTGLVVGELAPGPHEAGLWSVTGSHTSQFEQHLRAVLDYPLGPTTMTATAVATARVLEGAAPAMSRDERLHHLFGRDPAVRVHLYGCRAGHSGMIGHVTVLSDDPEEARARARAAATWLGEGRK